MTFVSPQMIMDAAKQEMLNGREPQNTVDWALIVNFIAYNADRKFAHFTVPFMCKLYNIPLDEGEVKRITNYQVALRDSVELRNDLFSRN